jgi:hypothetical protein
MDRAELKRQLRFDGKEPLSIAFALRADRGGGAGDAPPSGPALKNSAAAAPDSKNHRWAGRR